jgi:pimeloyl-ACP methyl ester carboxylesterase
LHHATLNGARIAYVDVPATGPDLQRPIVLVHGFASNHTVNWVNTAWVRVLTHAGRRVVALDNRGHGESQKFYRAEDYASTTMAADVAALIRHLGLGPVDVMGYSMGARIGAFLGREQPELVRSLCLGGLGLHLVDGVGLPLGIADALEAPSLADVGEPMARMFRAFAEQTGSDLKALAACIRGTRQVLDPSEVARMTMPVLVSVGTADPIAGDPQALAKLFPRGRAFDIAGRDHNLAVGDRSHKEAVLAFLADLG